MTLCQGTPIALFMHEDQLFVKRTDWLHDGESKTIVPLELNWYFSKEERSQLRISARPASISFNRCSFLCSSRQLFMQGEESANGVFSTGKDLYLVNSSDLRVFVNLVPVVQGLDSYRWITQFVLLTFIHRMAIYPSDSVIHPLDNCSLNVADS